MPAKAIALSSSVGELLRGRRRNLGYTLREVERLTSAHGNIIPFSTLARIEQGRLDPGLKRLHALLQLYGLPIQVAGDLLDIESIAGSLNVEGDFASLRERGDKAWQAGELPTAMACYLALRHRAADHDADRGKRHSSILAFAITAAKLGKHHIARHMLDDLLLDKPERAMRLRVFLQLGSTWHALGVPELALALIGAAEALIERDDRLGRGWVAHLRASIQIDLGQFAAARKNLVNAARVYQSAGKPYDRALALVTLARLEVEAGDAPAAIRGARRAARFAASKRFARVQALAEIQEARALLAAGTPERALTTLTRVLAETVAVSDNVIRFYCHFYLSKAYAVTGDSQRSHAELQQANYFVRFVDQASKEALEVRGHLKNESIASNR